MPPLDPMEEFAEEKPVEKPTEALPEPGVTKEEFAALKADLASKVVEIEGLKSKSAVVDKLTAALTGAPEDPKEAFIRKEIRRLVPEIEDVGQLKELTKALLETLHAASEEHTSERASSAQEFTRDLMKKAGLDPEDTDAVGYVEEALTREIKSNKDLMASWGRGNVKDAVTKAFGKVQAKLLAPVRANTKREAVQTIFESPKASPKGGTPAAGSGAKIDYADTSRENMRKVHDAAWARFSENSSE